MSTSKTTLIIAFSLFFSSVAMFKTHSWDLRHEVLKHPIHNILQMSYFCFNSFMWFLSHSRHFLYPRIKQYEFKNLKLVNIVRCNPPTICPMNPSVSDESRLSSTTCTLYSDTLAICHMCIARFSHYGLQYKA